MLLVYSCVCGHLLQWGLLTRGHTYFKYLINFILCLCMFCLLVCKHTACIQCPQRPEKGKRSPGTGVTDNCELPCGCWKQPGFSKRRKSPSPLSHLPIPKSHTLKESWPSLPQQLSVANSSLAGGGTVSPLNARILSGLSFPWFCARCHKHCKFIYAPALLCPENIVSLLSFTASGSYIFLPLPHFLP